MMAMIPYQNERLPQQENGDADYDSEYGAAYGVDHDAHCGGGADYDDAEYGSHCLTHPAIQLCTFLPNGEVKVLLQECPLCALATPTPTPPAAVDGGHATDGRGNSRTRSHKSSSSRAKRSGSSGRSDGRNHRSKSRTRRDTAEDEHEKRRDRSKSKSSRRHRSSSRGNKSNGRKSSRSRSKRGEGGDHHRRRSTSSSRRRSKRREKERGELHRSEHRSKSRSNHLSKSQSHTSGNNNGNRSPQSHTSGNYDGDNGNRTPFNRRKSLTDFDQLALEERQMERVEISKSPGRGMERIMEEHRRQFSQGQQQHSFRPPPRPNISPPKPRDKSRSSRRKKDIPNMTGREIQVVQYTLNGDYQNNDSISTVSDDNPSSSNVVEKQLRQARDKFQGRQRRVAAMGGPGNVPPPPPRDEGTADNHSGSGGSSLKYSARSSSTRYDADGNSGSGSNGSSLKYSARTSSTRSMTASMTSASSPGRNNAMENALALREDHEHTFREEGDDINGIHDSGNYYNDDDGYHDAPNSYRNNNLRNHDTCEDDDDDQSQDDDDQTQDDASKNSSAWDIFQNSLTLYRHHTPRAYVLSKKGFTKVLASRMAMFGKQHEYLAPVYEMLGHVERGLGRHVEALEYYIEALRILDVKIKRDKGVVGSCVGEGGVGVGVGGGSTGVGGGGGSRELGNDVSSLSLSYPSQMIPVSSTSGRGGAGGLGDSNSTNTIDACILSEHEIELIATRIRVSLIENTRELERKNGVCIGVGGGGAEGGIVGDDGSGNGGGSCDDENDEEPYYQQQQQSSTTIPERRKMKQNSNSNGRRHHYNRQQQQQHPTIME